MLMGMEVLAVVSPYISMQREPANAYLPILLWKEFNYTMKI